MHRHCLGIVVMAVWLSVMIPLNAAAVGKHEVIVTIKPLHALVSGIIGDTGEAALLLTGRETPHDFQLKPSQLAMMHNSKIIFYIDAQFEVALTRALQSLPPEIKTVAMTDTNGLRLLQMRRGGVWEQDAHDHDRHTHDDEHHDQDDDYGHHADDSPANRDFHIWLDPNNARQMHRRIAAELSALYPQHRSTYRRNVRRLAAKIDALNRDLSRQLAPVRAKPYIVFHDAYQYFEHHYRLNAVGAITLEPHESPAPGRISEIREKIRQSDVSCVFREPQFSERLINTVIAGSHVSIGVLDPLGVDFLPGADVYFELMRGLADNLTDCLKSA